MIIHTTVGNQSCPYGNQLYDTCSVALQPDDLTFDETFMRDISMSTSSVYFREFLAGYASMFSSIDDYRSVEVCLLFIVHNIHVHWQCSGMSNLLQLYGMNY